eukprot:TRINITY_DN11275_c0_g1_i1.p1 TRINITY_DN11275_c0_g1~~TRINITY_DN11275_c0_g1_i1.p1  ORF type:complete len:163 (+),score=48.23 TRINITY_DN11275_c0_g1_i1:35-490(+)
MEAEPSSTPEPTSAPEPTKIITINVEGGHFSGWTSRFAAEPLEPMQVPSGTTVSQLEGTFTMEAEPSSTPEPTSAPEPTKIITINVEGGHFSGWTSRFAAEPLEPMQVPSGTTVSQLEALAFAKYGHEFWKRPDAVFDGMTIQLHFKHRMG